MPIDLPRFVEDLSQAGNADDAWSALRTASAVCPGYVLFTVMTVDMRAGLAKRAHSSHPSEYPVSGTKPIKHDSWFEIVHGQKRSFVANSIEDIAAVFPDHELIRALGCESVMNLPVAFGDELVATINMLAPKGHFTQLRVAEAERELRSPALLCWRLAGMFDSIGEKPD